MNLTSQIKTIAFDADDTLWENETYFRASEEQFAQTLQEFLPPHTVNQELFKTEMNNLGLLGYGVKAFIISMIETAIQVTDGKIGGASIQKIIEIGKSQLRKPVPVLDKVESTLGVLKDKYRLVVATKGDLKEQRSKLDESGLAHFFHHIEVVSHKTPKEYKRLIGHLDVAPSEFLMIGNSMKSDIIPVLEIGGYAIHIPFHTTWEHEVVKANVEHERLISLESIDQILNYL